MSAYSVNIEAELNIVSDVQDRIIREYERRKGHPLSEAEWMRLKHRADLTILIAEIMKPAIESRVRQVAKDTSRKPLATIGDVCKL